MKDNTFNSFLSKIKKYNEVYIFGVGDVAKEVFFSLTNAPYDLKIGAFLVSNKSRIKNSTIEGVPVTTCDDEKINKDGMIIIAVLEKYRDEICKVLDENNMNNRILMTFESDLWSGIRSFSFKEHCNSNKYPYIFDLKKVEEDIIKQEEYDNKCTVYVTRSIKDKALSTKYDLRNWEKEIYGGAALDNINVEGIKDDNGLNISEKNRKYCELTAMYWAWKNTSSEYVGLSHYRRRFDFTDNEISVISNGYVDAVVTTPVINVPSVEYMYGKNHDLNDWSTMKKVVENIASEYTSALDTVEKSNYYIPYNMFIMKRSVFNCYCSWLFPILEECERIIGDKEDVYQNRYIGFLAERLMTVYFYYHRNDYNIVFCNKHFLE